MYHYSMTETNIERGYLTSMFVKALDFKKTIQIFRKVFIPKKLVQKAYSVSFIFPVVYCSAQPPKKIELAEPSNLTHSFLLKQASSVTVNSVAQLLSYTVLAIIDTAGLYKKALNDVMSLIEESQANIGNELFQQEMSDTMIAFRAKVNEYKSQIVELESLFEYVEKVAVSATETSFLIGAEYASSILSERLYSAKQEISKEKKIIEDLERDYLELQKTFINYSSDQEKKTPEPKS